MEKTKTTASELSFMFRMLHVLSDSGSIEKIYRMLLSLATGGRSIGFDRAMLLLVDKEGGVVKGHIGVERKIKGELAVKETSFEKMSKQVFDNFERVDSSDLTLKLRTFSVPFGWHRSAIVKAALSAYPVLAEGKLSEFATDPFFKYMETKSYLAMPLKIGSGIRAVLVVDNAHSGNSIDVDDVSFIFSLCQYTSRSIEDLLEAADNERKFRILLKLEQALQSAGKSGGIEDVLKLSLVMISQAVGGTGSFLKDSVHGRTVHVKSVRACELQASEYDIAIAECFEKILDKVAVRTEPVSGDGGHALVSETISDILAHFFVCPFSNASDVVGALGVYVEKQEGGRERGAFSSKDRKFLELCAGIIALKLDSRDKKQKLTHQEQLLEEARSNLTRERSRSRIGEKGIEYHKRIETYIQKIRKALDSQLPVEKQLSRVTEILGDIEKSTLSYKADFSFSGSHFKMVDIFKVTKRIVAKWKPKAEEIGLDVTVRIPGKGPQLLMDETKISLAIENILRSVTSSLKEDDKVLVECSSTDGKAVIAFADSGIGLPGDVISRLFMPFTEIGSGDERKRAMSLAGEILHTHAGEINVKSSRNWKTILELSFSKMGNQDRRRNRSDRRRQTPDKRLPLKHE